MTLDQLYERGKEFAKIAFDRQGEVHPMWIVETADGMHIPVTLPFGIMKDKDLAAAMIQNLLAQTQAVRYVSLLESWMAEMPKEYGKEKMLEEIAIIPVSERPDRKEIVWIIAEDKFHKKAGYYTIIRPETGKPHLSEFMDASDSEEMEGRFVSLLDSGQAIQ